MNIIIEDGKYEYRFYPDGNSEVLRYGEPWRDTVGDKLMYCMASEIEQLRARVVELEQSLSRIVSYYDLAKTGPSFPSMTDQATGEH